MTDASPYQCILAGVASPTEITLELLFVIVNFLFDN